MRRIVHIQALAAVVAVVASHDISGSNLIRDLVDPGDQNFASFLSQLQTEEEDDLRSYMRALDEDDNSPQQFGQRCGNRNACAQGFECEQAGIGKRCLPKTCLQEHAKTGIDAFDIDTYKQRLYDEAGFTEDEIIGKLAEVRDEQKFLQTEEFQSLRASLHSNLGPLQAMQNLTKTCIDPYQDGGTVSYIGLHIEAGLFVDATLQYLVASNGDDQRSVLRMCLGAEIGAGAEISYIFGFTNTQETHNMLCGSAVFDAELFLIVIAGAAVGIQFNNVFFYEFTFGGGLSEGIGGSLCAGLQYGNATIERP